MLHVPEIDTRLDSSESQNLPIACLDLSVASRRRENDSKRVSEVAGRVEKSGQQENTQ